MSTTTPSMTAEELIKLPRGNCRYELVKGELLTMSPAGARHGAVIINLTLPLAHHVKTHNLGVVFGAETGFTVERNPDTVLAPDIAFVRRARIAKVGEGYWEGAPDLAVEVVSPSDSKSKIEKKVRCWLEGGASTVWIVNPKSRTVSVHRTNVEAILLCEGDELFGGDIVSGFRFPVSEIFS